MADILPAFPLSLVAFPGEMVNLHIFEPRYKQLINECDASGKTFSIIPYFEGRPMIYGTEVKLVSISKRYKDGKMDIATKGVSLIKVLDFFNRAPSKLFPAVEYERISGDNESDIILASTLLDQLKVLYEVLNVDNVELKPVDLFKTFDVAHKVGFNVDQELEFLAIPDEKDRQQYLQAHLEKFIPIAQEMENLRRKAALNGHFKNITPPIL